jgi:cysteine desulfurase
MGVDLLSISAHKFHGPRGVGALYVRKGVRLDPIVHGGHQERERRAGTENVAGIAGLTEALDLALAAAPAERARLAELEDVFLKTLTSADVTFQVNGPKADKASGVVNLSLQGVRSHDMVIGMDISGYAISAGSACSAGVIEASPVLIAMGLDRDRASAGVRVSFGRGNTIEDARGAARAMARLQADLRSASIPTAAEAG